MSELGQNDISEPRPDITPLIGCGRGALVIRHAERFGGEVATNKDGLTSNGKAAARLLGERLKGVGPLRFFASPVPRCVDTASLISEGAGGDGNVATSNLLGDPGPFIIDMAEVDRKIAALGLKGFAVRWLSGGISPKAMRPSHEGNAMMIRWIASNLSSRSTGVDVYVGHDLFLTPALVDYAGYDVAANGLLGFLDGFCLTEEGYGLRMVYRERSVVLNNHF